MNKYLKNISLIGKFSQTMEYIPTEDFPNFENISLPANEMLWLSTKYEYFPTSSRKSEDFSKISGVADMKVDMVADLEVDMVADNVAAWRWTWWPTWR